jgi:predicted transcriptional regulator
MSLAGLQTITGINRKQLSHYVTGHSKPSPATVRKIEQGIKAFAEELSRVAFL